MQCPTCNAILPNNVDYCYHCGTRLLAEVSPESNPKIPKEPSGASENWQEGPTVVSNPSFPPQLEANQASEIVVPAFPVSHEFYEGAGVDWNELNGGNFSAHPTAEAGIMYTSTSPIPGASESIYGPSGAHSYIPGYGPGPLPPYSVQPAAKSGRPGRARTILLSFLVVLAIFSSGFIGYQLGLGQAHQGSGSLQASTVATPVASATPDANQLYQQITGRAPTYVDSLTNPTSSQWSLNQKPTFGCTIKDDGLHILIQDTNEFTYCTSGRGQFSAFAFQISMKILSGNGGGMTLRGDTTAGNFYYFHVYPDGTYRIYINQNNKLTTELGGGTISPFASGFGQENTLTVIAQKDQMDFYANQKFITTVHDSTYTNGYLGLLSEASTNPGEVVYTNARIWVL